MQNKITFKPLAFSDISLLHQWFNKPHVQAFYSLRSWTEDEVLAKLTPYITGEKPVSGFIILLDENPIGYLQSYKVSDYPWPEQDLPDGIVRNAMGLDLFIGKSELIKKGWGRKIIQTFIETHVSRQYQYCVVDPDISNDAAVRCYEKLKFKEHKILDTVDALKRPAKIKLMILKCTVLSR